MDGEMYLDVGAVSDSCHVCDAMSTNARVDTVCNAHKGDYNRVVHVPPTDITPGCEWLGMYADIAQMPADARAALFWRCIHQRAPLHVCECVWTLLFEADTPHDVCASVVEVCERITDITDTYIHDWVWYILQKFFIDMRATCTQLLSHTACSQLVERAARLALRTRSAVAQRDVVADCKEQDAEQLCVLVDEALRSATDSQTVLVAMCTDIGHVEVLVQVWCVFAEFSAYSVLSALQRVRGHARGACLAYAWTQFRADATACRWIADVLAVPPDTHTDELWRAVLSGDCKDCAQRCAAYFYCFTHDPDLYVLAMSHMSCAAQIPRARTERALYDVCRQNFVQCARETVHAFRNYHFLYAYIDPDTGRTALDWLIEHFARAEHNDAYFFFFDNYVDDAALYPAMHTETFHTLYAIPALEDLCEYFLHTYVFDVEYFCESPLFVRTLERDTRVRSDVLRLYPEIVFDDRAAAALGGAVDLRAAIENTPASREKIGRLCRSLYVPDILLPYVEMTCREYYDLMCALKKQDPRVTRV